MTTYLASSFGSTLIRRGVSIEVVSKLMGHSILQLLTTSTYMLQEQQAMAMDMVSVC